MFYKVIIPLMCCLIVCTWAQKQGGPTTTPVPILKQINRQNDDGSYSYGYEGADGSFKIETKYPNGDVAGKYGYIDENGKLREVAYGASSARGFEPQGPGIMVPPPTLNEPSNDLTNADTENDDGQYREDPKIYEDPKYNGKLVNKPGNTVLRQYHKSVPVQSERQYQPEPQYSPEPQYQYSQPKYQHQPAYQQETSQSRSTPLYSQQTSLYNPSQSFQREYRPQSQVFHQQPQFTYQGYTPQPYNQYTEDYTTENYQGQRYQNLNYQPRTYQPQTYQPQTYQPQTYQPQAYQPQTYQPEPYQPQNYHNYHQNYNPFAGHPAQNFDPNTGSYTINFTG